MKRSDRKGSKGHTPKPGELVLVDHGSTGRGQVAVVVEVLDGDEYGTRNGLVIVRKYRQARVFKGENIPAGFKEAQEIPKWKILGAAPPPSEDKRVAAASATLEAEKASAS